MHNGNFLAILIPVACFMAAGMPLLIVRRLRPMLLGAAGSGCIGFGAIGVAAIGFGLTPMHGAIASEKEPGDDGSPESSSINISSDSETIVIPEGRPSWVGLAPNYQGKTHTIPVASGPYAAEGESRRALDQALVKAMNEYLVEHLGSELAPTFLRYNARAIKKRFVSSDNVYHDVAKYSVGDMHEHFALLELGPDFRKEVDRRWAEVQANSRLTQTGLLAGAALLIVGSVFGYYRADNATRGYYTVRLQFMTAAAILAVIGAGAVVAQRIHWL